MKKLYGITLLAIMASGAYLICMDKSKEKATHETIVTLTTSDNENIKISKIIAQQLAPIKDYLEIASKAPQTGGIAVQVSKKTLNTFIAILEQLAVAPNIRRPDGNFIAKRVQPIVDRTLQAENVDEIVNTIKAAPYFDLPVILNAAVRTLITKIYNRNPNISVNTIVRPQWFARALANQIRPIVQYQLELVKTGIPELSIGDYIAINGQPTQSNQMIRLDGKVITSLDGLNEIQELSNIKVLSLDRNQITTIQPDALRGLTNLSKLSLSENEITTIHPDAFRGLANLNHLDLSLNQITTIQPGTFRMLANLNTIDLSDNPITDTLSTKELRTALQLPPDTLIFG